MNSFRASDGRRSRRARISLAVTITAAVFGVSACGSSSGGAPSGSGGTASGGHHIVIGFSQRRVAGSDWYKTLIAGAQYEANKLGDKIEVLDAGGDTTQQNQDIQTLLTRNVNAVVLNANDPDGLASGILAMKRDHVPFVEVNSNLSPSLTKDAACYIAENQVTTGAKVGRAIAQDAIKRYGTHASVKLVAIGGYPGDVITGLRWKGFEQGYKAVMANYPGFHTTNLPLQYGHWLPDQALSPIEDIASANPTLRIVYSESDVMQAGVEHGLQGAGLWNKNILEGSYDGGMNGIQEMVQQPNGPMQADGANVPFDQGAQAVRLVAAAVAGKASSVCPKGTELISTPLVTPANAKHYYNAKLTHVQIPPAKVKLTATPDS